VSNNVFFMQRVVSCV